MPKPILPARVCRSTGEPDTRVNNGSEKTYLPVYADVAFRMRLLGATYKDIYEALNISHMTFHRWMGDIPTFKESVESGGIEADAKVAHSLYQRATGYTFKSTKVFYDRATGEPVYAPVDEHCPPDVAACKHWLTVRNHGFQWTDKQQVEVTGANGTPLLPPNIVILPVKAATAD